MIDTCINLFMILSSGSQLEATMLVTLPWTRPLVMLYQMGKVDI